MFKKQSTWGYAWVFVTIIVLIVVITVVWGVSDMSETFQSSIDPKAIALSQQLTQQYEAANPGKTAPSKYSAESIAKSLSMTSTAGAPPPRAPVTSAYAGITPEQLANVRASQLNALIAKPSARAASTGYGTIMAPRGYTPEQAAAFTKALKSKIGDDAYNRLYNKTYFL